MKKSIPILVLASLLAACVTINIYFPAAAADKAADKIIDDVWQLKNGDSSKTEATKDKVIKEVPPPAAPAPEAK